MEAVTPQWRGRTKLKKCTTPFLAFFLLLCSPRNPAPPYPLAPVHPLVVASLRCVCFCLPSQRERLYVPSIPFFARRGQNPLRSTFLTLPPPHFCFQLGRPNAFKQRMKMCPTSLSKMNKGWRKWSKIVSKVGFQARARFATLPFRRWFLLQRTHRSSTSSTRTRMGCAIGRAAGGRGREGWLTQPPPRARIFLNFFSSVNVHTDAFRISPAFFLIPTAPAPDRPSEIRGALTPRRVCAISKEQKTFNQKLKYNSKCAHSVV